MKNIPRAIKLYEAAIVQSRSVFKFFYFAALPSTLVEDIQPCLGAFKCVFVHVMTFLPFKFFFLKYRKPSFLVILVSVA